MKTVASGIYVIQHKGTRRAYVGSSRNISVRIRHHLNDLKAGRHYNHGLQADWLSDGPEAFVTTLVEEVDDDNRRLNDAERRWCQLLKESGVDLYCRQIGGRKPGYLTVPGLKRQRLLAALTQAQLAEKTGVIRLTITRLESGREATPTTVRKLADALGCSPADLYQS